ncbi:MAG: hypothetical protein QOI59_2130 [Gammaproteobacteria bacterium]|nr:hypothetical protein [Gammaproteobacteria bacterium]
MDVVETAISSMRDRGLLQGRPAWLRTRFSIRFRVNLECGHHDGGIEDVAEIVQAEVDGVILRRAVGNIVFTAFEVARCELTVGKSVWPAREGSALKLGLPKQYCGPETQVPRCRGTLFAVLCMQCSPCGRNPWHRHEDRADTAAL